MHGGPPERSTIGGPPRPVPTRTGFPTMAIMMMLPLIVGSLAGLVNSWSGFIEAAFMDMTLTLEDFDYGFGPVDCGAWVECGNATFESYLRSRDLAAVLFILALVAVAVKDMVRGGLGGDVDLGSVDTKTLPEMLKYSVLVFAFLFVFPPVWDVAAGAMNNVGVWILNPMYDLAGRGEFVHGLAGLGSMCVGHMTHDDLAALAPYVRDWDAWSVYAHGDTGPMKNGEPSLYAEADNYIVQDGGVLTRECIHDMDDASCPWAAGAVPRPVPPPNYQIGDVLCNPDLKVKYVFRQALGVTELEVVNPEEILGAVTGTGGDQILVAILTQFIKSSVTLQVIMVVFMTGVMVDVVTAFALSILPIVFFYRFLPMSDKVRLGDYGGAAFALLSMPMVASLVLTAGAGAVVAMAVDDMAFGSFFVWLSALSVVLLVIGIPATLVPLIGAAQQQATAAIQTGVQTAQLAATATVAAAGGAVRGRRANMEFGRLASMAPGMMTPSQKTRLAELDAAGQGKMSAARAALMGGMGGVRRQMFDASGAPAQRLRQLTMPETGPLTAASVQGLGGFQTPDSTQSVAGLAGTLGAVGTETAGAVMSEAKAMRPPTNADLLDAARKREAEAKKAAEVAAGRVADAKADAMQVDGYAEEAATKLSAERLAEVESGNLAEAQSKMDRLAAKKTGAEARRMDLTEQGLHAEAAKMSDMINGLNGQISTLNAETARAQDAVERHMRVAEYEAERLAQQATGGAIGGAVGSAILTRQTANRMQQQAQDELVEAAGNHRGMAKEMRQSQNERQADHKGGSPTGTRPTRDGGSWRAKFRRRA